MVSALTSKLRDKIVSHKDEIAQYEAYSADEDMDVLVVSYGSTARSSLFAVHKLRQEGKKVGMLRLITIWPFPDTVVNQFAAKAKKLLVPEMNLGQIAGELTKYVRCEVVSFPQVTAEIIYPGAITKQLRRLV